MLFKEIISTWGRLDIARRHAGFGVFAHIAKLNG